MFEITYKKSAIKGLRKMPAGTREKALASIKLVAENPDRQDLDIKPLSGRPGYRLRVGGWRVLYHRDNDRLVILVVDVGPRGDIYK